MTDSQKRVLAIKHMVCPRCITVVRDALEAMKLHVHEVSLGEAVIDDDGTPEAVIDKKLREHSFELIRPRAQQRANDIKEALDDYLKRMKEEEQTPKLSKFLSERFHQNYSGLSAAFSEAEDITIEKYFIRRKVEQVKELLDDQESTLSDIAWKLNYSSAAHLSSQFKQVTGLSPTQYQKSRTESASR